MEKVNLSILVVNCKDFKPSHNWYLCKSERCFYGTAKTPDIIGYQNKFDDKFDFSVVSKLNQIVELWLII